jgi:uncharacterized protein (TIGR02265 family)
MRFTIGPDDPLPALPDLEARVAETPQSATVKGEFLRRLAETIGDGWERLPLLAPPRFGRYIPFRDYPTRDYRRLLIAAARRRYPQLHLAEGVRRLQRDNLATFAGSMLGSVTMSMLGSAEAAFLRMPGAYGLILRPVSVRASTTFDARGERVVRLDYESYLGWLDCAEIGSVEGVVLYYGHTPRIEADLPGHHTGTYLVRW